MTIPVHLRKYYRPSSYESSEEPLTPTERCRGEIILLGDRLEDILTTDDDQYYEHAWPEFVRRINRLREIEKELEELELSLSA